MKLSQITKELNLNFDGKDIEINTMQTLSNAKAGELSFVESQKYINDLKTTKASAILLTKEFEKELPSNSIALICDNPRLMMAKATKFFQQPDFLDDIPPTIDKSSNISKTAFIGSGTTVGKNATIYPSAYIGQNVKIGDSVKIYPNVTIYNNSIIGDEVTIHAGTTIGSDGFGYVPSNTGEHIKIYHLGNAIIEDRVEIGANCAIDRGVFGSTIVKTGAKLDNLVHLAHNCEIGEGSFIAGQVGLAGSTIVGKFVSMGGQSASAGHLKIGDFSQIAGKCGVISSIEGGKTYSGFPARVHRDWLRLQAKLSKIIKNKDR